MFSITELRAAYYSGETLKYLFFWGHRPSWDGAITKTCLSQWFESPFECDGIRYSTAEQFMMAEKARLFKDALSLQHILKSHNPGAIKKLGREVLGFDEDAWNEARLDIVVRGNMAKFSQNLALQQFLINTGDRVLAEASPTDKIWGIGMSETDPGVENPNLWKGLNLLGFALMEVRSRLKPARLVETTNNHKKERRDERNNVHSKTRL